MLELQDNAAFKDHLRDFLVQTKSFSSQDNADLFADEAAAAREVGPFVSSVNLLSTKTFDHFPCLCVNVSNVSYIWVHPHSVEILHVLHVESSVTFESTSVVIMASKLVSNYISSNKVSTLDSRAGVCMQAERQRLANIPGMLNPNEQQEEMLDA